MADTRLEQLAKTDRNPIEEEEYQRLLSSSGDLNFNQLSKLMQSQSTGSTNLLAGQEREGEDWLRRYSEFLKSQEGASAMARRIGDELGIPTLRQGATMLRNTYTNLPTTYSKATTGYDVNQNQLSRIIGQKASELYPMVQTAETSLADAQEQLGLRMGYEMADQEKALAPWQAEQSMMIDRWAREATMFSLQNQRELDALISKLQMGVTLSEGEKNRANQLAIAEKNYLAAKEAAEAERDARPPVSTETGDWMWDSSTGQWVPVYD